MAEFKFSCPQCGQHIACDTGYTGSQITCPACQQAIVVPQAPGLAPAPAAGLATRVSTTAPAAGQRFTGAPTPGSQPPPKKSNLTRNLIIIAASIVVLAALGAGGWFGYSAIAKHGKKGNPAAQVAAPSAASAIQALSLLTKVRDAYTNLNSVTANASFHMFLDVSNLTMGDMNPRMATDAKNAKRRPPGMPRSFTNATEFTIKRSGSNWYYIVGDAISKADRMNFTNTFAFWSSDKGRFMFMDEHRGPARMVYRQLPDITPGDLMMQQMVMKNFQQVFSDPAQMAKIVKNLGQTADETVDGQFCSTLTAKVLGQKIKLWVDKTTYHVSQIELVLGGQITDEDIDDLFDVLGSSVPIAKAQFEKAKPDVKKVTQAMTKIQGTLTFTTRNREINPTLTAEDFDYAVPTGVRLVSMQQNGARKPRTATPPATTTAPPAPADAAPIAPDSRNACINNLRQIDGAKNEWALEKGKANGTAVTEDDLKPYLKLNADGSFLKCPDGGKYTIGKVGEVPTCSVAGHTLP